MAAQHLGQCVFFGELQVLADGVAYLGLHILREFLRQCPNFLDVAGLIPDDSIGVIQIDPYQDPTLS